jgi:hypothetical protein
MTVKTSTGLRNAMLDTGSFKGTMATAKLMIYSGTAPADADAATTGTLLCTVTGPTAAALAWDTSALGGVISKSPSQTWSGTCSAGTAGYYRVVNSADTGASSTTQPRIQGTVDVAGADLNLSSTTFAGGATQTIDYYSVALPTG